MHDSTSEDMSETAKIEPVAPRPRPRYRQFSLRTLLLLVTAFCIWFGWLSQRAHRQARAVAAVKAAKGDVHYDFEGRMAVWNPPAPEWLCDTLGIDYFSNVVFVRLEHPLPDEDLDAVIRLPKLQILEFLYVDVDDRDLEKLKDATNLKTLYVMSHDKHERALDDLRKTLPDLQAHGLWEAPPDIPAGRFPVE
jgi:hypothetical protein